MRLFERAVSKVKILFLSLIVIGCAPLLQSEAEEGEKKFSDIAEITDISLHYTDDSGEPEPEAIRKGMPVEKNELLALRYTYKIPADQLDSVAADTAYYLEISPHLVLPENVCSILTAKTEDGDVDFGKICADGRRAWITFDAKKDGPGTVLSGIGELEGTYFYLQCRRAENPPDGEGPAEGKPSLYAVKFENGKELILSYAELEQVEAQAAIVKKGRQQDKTIVWTIAYTPWQNPDPAAAEGLTADTPFELRDAIDGTVQDYVEGSIKIEGVPVTEYRERGLIPEDAESYAIVEKSGDSTVLSIGGRKLCAGTASVGDPAKPLHITYETALQEELFLPVSKTAGDLKVSNRAVLFAKKDGVFNEMKISGSCEAVVKRPEWIKKEGKTTRHLDGTGSTTDWTVTFSPNGFVFAEENELTLHDRLPEGSSLVSGSVQTDGGGVLREEAENNGFTVSSMVTAGGDITVKYQTKVPEDMYDNGRDLGENTAWFTFRYGENDYETPPAKTPVGSGDGSGRPGTATLVKENGGYRAKDRSIVWTVKINPHSVYLKSGTFTDDLGKTGGNCGIAGHTGGLELAGKGVDDIEVLLGDQPISDLERNLVNLKYEGRVLTVSVGEIGARKLTLIYRTTVCDPCVFANNTVGEPFVNRISTTDMVVGSNSSEKRESSAQSTADVSATVLTKKAPVYDYASGIMKWTVEVDEAELPMTDVVLTDTLPAGLSFVDKSFRTDPEIPGAHLTVEGDRLIMDLGKVTAKTLVMFDTKADPETVGFNSDGNVKIENTVSMCGSADGIDFVEVSHSVEQDFINHGLVKSGKVDNRREWVEYEVLINPFGLPLPEECALVDTLDKRLQLDEDTLLFYEAEVFGESDGIQSPEYTKTGDGQPLKIMDFDPETNSFTVRLPVGEKSKDAYLLTYRADIVERQADGYENSIRFEGGDVRLGDMKKNSVLVSGGGGGGGGIASRRAELTITHTDSKTKHPLAGVTFTLYRWDEKSGKRGLAVAQRVTDAFGKASFQVKPGVTYELVETRGISGYEDSPGCELLPEGVTEGGEGFLFLAKAAGIQQELYLTSEAKEPVGPEKPDNSGGTGDGGTGSSGIAGGGNSGDTENRGDTGSTGGGGSAVPGGGEETVGADTALSGKTPGNMPAAEEELRLWDKGHDSSGKTVKGPETGDITPEPKGDVLLTALTLAAAALLLFVEKKRSAP